MGNRVTKVLIVDDEKDFTFFVKKNLEADGAFEVGVCHEGQQAYERVKQLNPDIVILDMMMPDMTGEDVASQLRDDPSTESIPIVFLTALVKEEETEKNAHMIGGQFFVAKPVKVDELVRVIRKALA